MNEVGQIGDFIQTLLQMKRPWKCGFTGLNYKNLIIIAIVLICASCAKNTLKKELLKLQSEVIELPQNATITIAGQDTTIVDWFKSDLKMVVFVDSIECTSCAINRMALWESLIQYADSIENLSLRYYFIFAPSKKDRKTVRASLSVNPISYPILIDDIGEFQRMNPHLPDNKALHSFLLNRENQVVLVGDPILNTQILDLFYKTITDLRKQ